MSKLIMGNERPDKFSLAQMRDRGGEWAAYQNMDMGHRGLGHLMFLRYGPECTYKKPPNRMPDTSTLLCWRYFFVGKIDLITGEIKGVKDNGKNV